MRRLLAFLLAPLLLAGTVSAAEQKKEESLDGYAEWRHGELLIVDGQRLVVDEATRFKGEKDARDLSSIPLGYEVKAKGTRRADGAFLAREVEAKPNGTALFEKEVRSLTDEAEAKYRRAGQYYLSAKRKVKVIGRLYDEGPEVERVWRIVDRVLPPYINPDDVRVYVIENKEWNAFAMGNFSIYVFSGLLDAVDDDELAIVLGHEIAHATHEHTRREFKKAMWIQLAAIGATVIAEEKIDDRKKRAVVELLTQFLAIAWSNGYGRDLEDQADRVGLRYAYEAGYDVTRGPTLWRRFAKKYGEQGKVANFFFSDHSRSVVRASNLERELALNYPEGPKPGGPAVSLASDTVRKRDARTSATAAGTGSGSALASERKGRTQRAEIKVGMTPDQVRGLLGPPDDEVVFGRRTRWRYPDFTVVFEDGKVKEVRF